MGWDAATRGRGRMALVFIVSTLPVGGCDREKAAEPATSSSAAASASAHPCALGDDVDPPAGRLLAVRDQFEQKDYAQAERALRALAKEYPYSAVVRFVLGDTLLYGAGSDTAEYEHAAQSALPQYAQARALVHQGCPLAERDEYYLLMGSAYAHLRERDGAAATAVLEEAYRRWPTSAEITYHLARAACLRGDVAECAARFETTLHIARALQRPRFLRTHHSVDDWIRRSRTQSEFPPLRKSPAYAKLLKRVESER